MLGTGKVRTRLEWDGKQTQVDKVKLPFQQVEVVNEPRTKTMDTFVPRTDKWYNILIWGDNKLVMSSLLPEFAGKIDLIYIDPPFATGADFTLNVKVEDEGFAKEASAIETKAYRDTWGQGLASYLQMMYDRLVLMRDLLANDGQIWVHMDWHVGHYVKVLMDEIFGKENFRNQIIWKRTSAHSNTKSCGNIHDMILNYTKSDQWVWNTVYQERDLQYVESHYRYVDKDGRRYRTDNLISPDPTGGYRYEWHGNIRNWRMPKERMQQLEKEGRIVYTKVGTAEYKRYLDESPGTSLQDIWTDIPPINSQAKERLGFPTQKPEALLERIVRVSSNEGDLIADFFVGAGTTLAVAEKLGRKWIGCDLSKFAINLTRKRLLEIPGCSPFQIMNLGRYQKQKLIENSNGEKKYFDFLLQLYNASPIQGFAYIHGKKAERLVHVGSADSFVTIQEIRESCREALNVNAKGIDILGWDFEMGLHDLLKELERGYGIDIKLKQIPLEVLEIKAAEATRTLEEIRFYDLNYLDLGLETQGLEVTVYIKKFAIANPEYIPPEIRETIKNFASYIDYWAVDFDYRGDVFHNMRQEYRTRKSPELKTQLSYRYDAPGKYDILVKVVDILGNDTNKILHARVR